MQMQAAIPARAPAAGGVARPQPVTSTAPSYPTGITFDNPWAQTQLQRLHLANLSGHMGQEEGAAIHAGLESSFGAPWYDVYRDWQRQQGGFLGPGINLGAPAASAVIPQHLPGSAGAAAPGAPAAAVPGAQDILARLFARQRDLPQLTQGLLGRGAIPPSVQGLLGMVRA